MTETSSATCVGIIMDGNRRWAKAKGLPKLEGHRRGADKLKDTVRFARERGIKHLAVYAFSTENWNREPAEVSYLMDLFRELVKRELKKMGEEGARVRFAGQHERFSDDLQQAINDVEKETEKNEAITLWVCLSYGGRAEIVAAAVRASMDTARSDSAESAAKGGEITEETLAQNLWTAGMPEPDIIIRTGGEKRLSGFLAWQSIYSELFFIDTLWPDFTEKEFDAILAEFASRERRRGK